MFPAPGLPKALKNFEILERLGSGGAGQVYLARSPAGRRVAIKVLTEGKERDIAFAHALVREASLCVRLNHPAIVQVRAFIEEEGFTAIVFDYIDGISLSRLMKFCAAVGARLPDRAGWLVVERVLAALAFAHAQLDEADSPVPIVHRDVSPSNVLISWDADVKLTDFGIAKMLGVSPATQIGLVKGTLGCMAPEQARGDPVDERADVYAAGLLAWRLSTGRNPFAAKVDEELEVLRAMKHPRFKPLAVLRPNLPEPLLEAVASALSPNPQRRTITAERFARVVAEHVDLRAGKAELARLLGRWRGALEKRPKKSAEDPKSLFSSGNHKNATARYEDIAVFDEEDIPVDGPTVQTAALPGDEELWKALAMQGALDLPRVTISDSEVAPATEEMQRVAEAAMAKLAAVDLFAEEPDEESEGSRDAVVAPTERSAPTVRPPAPKTSSRVLRLVVLLVALVLLGALAAWSWSTRR